MKLTHVVWIAVLIWVFEVLLVSVLVRDDWLFANIEAENADQRAFFGERTARYLEERTDRSFERLFIQSLQYQGQVFL